jgi:hypothetical protein
MAPWQQQPPVTERAEQPSSFFDRYLGILDAPS